MPFAASLSEHPLATHATGEAVGDVLDQLDLREGEAPDLVALFVTAPHVGALEDISATVASLLRPRVLLGASAVSVLAGDHEAEDTTALSLFAARWRRDDPVPLTPLRIDDIFEPDAWFESTPLATCAQGSTLLLLVDPFSLSVRDVLRALATHRPDIAVIGGMASAAQGPGGNRLVLDEHISSTGAVGVIVDPAANVGTLVSQGCRPIGAPLIVTRSERNILFEIGGEPALDRLMESLRSLPPEELELAAGGVHLGRAVDESRAEFSRGDFVVRNVIGVDKELGAVAVGDLVDVGTTVQFQVRDASSADEDLRTLTEGVAADGALVFTCNGRGVRFFGEPSHDAVIVSEALGHRAVAGMFCAGELGPVGGQNFVHGYTASVALFNE